MSTLTIPRDQLRTDLRPGDQITAIDGRPADHRVAGVKHLIVTAVGGIRLHNSIGSGVEWNLYPDTQVEHDVTVERADTEPAPQPRKTAVQRRERRQTRHGLTLVSGRLSAPWETEDGTYSIQQGYAWTECDGPHPMRWKDDNGVLHTGYCIGEQQHEYVVGWFIDGPQIPGVYELGEPHESFDDAWAFLARALGVHQ